MLSLYLLSFSLYALFSSTRKLKIVIFLQIWSQWRFGLSSFILSLKSKGTFTAKNQVEKIKSQIKKKKKVSFKWLSPELIFIVTNDQVLWLTNLSLDANALETPCGYRDEIYELMAITTQTILLAWGGKQFLKTRRCYPNNEKGVLSGQTTMSYHVSCITNKAS